MLIRSQGVLRGAFIVVWEVLVSARRELNGCLRNFGQREEPPGSRESVWCGFESAALTRAMQQSRLATRTTQVGACRILCHREVGRAFGVVSSHWLPRGAMQQSRPAARTTPVGVGRVLNHWEAGGAFGVVSRPWLPRGPCSKVVWPRAQRRLGWVAF